MSQAEEGLLQEPQALHALAPCTGLSASRQMKEELLEAND